MLILIGLSPADFKKAVPLPEDPNAPSSIGDIHPNSLIPVRRVDIVDVSFIES